MFLKVKNLSVIGIAILSVGSCADQSGTEWQYLADIDRDGTLESVSVVDFNGNG